MTEGLAQDVENFMSTTKGDIHLNSIRKEVDIGTKDGYGQLRVTMHRLCKRGLTAHCAGRGDGWYRWVDKEAPEIDWQNADPSKSLDLLFPFQLENYIKIYPGDLIILAGEKNAGKTAWLMNFTYLNMGNPMVIDYFNSGEGKEVMHQRWKPFNIPVPAPFRVRERYDHFDDVINPDGINVIDYIDLNSDFYMAGDELNKIFITHKTGVTIAGLQIPPASRTIYKGQEIKVHRDLAYGGGTTAKRAAVYIALWDDTPKKMKLVYAKSRANPKINPNNMQWTYRLDDEAGVEFIDVKRYFGEGVD